MAKKKTIIERYRPVLEVGDHIESERVFIETALMLYNSDCYNSEIENSRNIVLTRLIYPQLLVHKLLSVRPEMVPTDTDKRKLGCELPPEIADIMGIDDVTESHEMFARLMKVVSDNLVMELNTRLIHHFIKNSITHKNLSSIDGIDLHEVNLVGGVMGADFMFVNTRIADKMIDVCDTFKLEHSANIQHGTHLVGTVDLPCGTLDVYENTFAPNDFILLGCKDGMIYRPNMICNIEGNQIYSYDIVEEYEGEHYYHFFKVNS